jgi:hypothetical protein
MAHFFPVSRKDCPLAVCVSPARVASTACLIVGLLSLSCHQGRDLPCHGSFLRSGNDPAVSFTTGAFFSPPRLHEHVVFLFLFILVLSARALAVASPLARVRAPTLERKRPFCAVQNSWVWIADGT